MGERQDGVRTCRRSAAPGGPARPDSGGAADKDDSRAPVGVEGGVEGGSRRRFCRSH